MKEIPLILDAWRQASAAGEELVLATVVKVEGSAYRRPGARMAITANGEAIGTISGGCLESHVTKRSWWLTESGEPVLCRYDTGAEEDTQWAFGLGCNGVVHVLMERLSSPRSAMQLELLAAVRESFRPAATAVVIVADAAGELKVGERLAIFPDSRRGGEFAEAALADRVTHDLAAALRNGCSELRSYPVAGGRAEVFLEVLPPPVRLVVFGAGHDAQPLVRIAKELGWHVSVADGRANHARADRFPDADRVVVAAADEAIAAAGVTRDSVVVVMTHSVDQDKALLARLLRDPPRYLGQLGPRSRTERLLREISEENPQAPPLPAADLHAPVGLDIGADTPEEIALAIVAEIRAALAGRDGGMLRRIEGSIHD